jgi:aryl-alcohol dehydrogenase-like predicted oxidoreductase
MQYTRLGNSGLIISRLAFGAMTFGSDPTQPAIYKVDRENARAMIDKALDAGSNFFDTADSTSSRPAGIDGQIGRVRP